MIHILEITAPLAGTDGLAAESTLSTQMAKVIHFYPALLDAQAEAAEGSLTLRLRVKGRSRWDISYKARKIASSMLRRVGIDPATGTLVLVDMAPAATKLTKEEGRNVSGHVPRGW